MSWGKVHPDVISVQAMLKNAGFQVPEINGLVSVLKKVEEVSRF